ncbi:MAG: MarR family transcriptional regulator [Bdellovibrionaceae bacterium]|nr:MarR family transcriptional regulator [Pseudobdellovibrionaceae bacterium]
MSIHESELLSLFRIGISIHNFNKITERELGLSLVQWCLLTKLIDMPAASAFALAKGVGVHPSTLTQSLKRLEKKGFVHVADDPRDCRRKMISLTRTGQEALQTAEEKMSTWKMNFSGVKKELVLIQEYLANQISDSLEAEEGE